MSRLLFGLGDVHDVEGRPLGERRASSAAKRGCPMELAPCAYDDGRKNVSMNVSALEQIKRHLGGAHEEVSAFHASLEGDIDPLDRMFMAVLDQLLAPALFLIAHADDDASVSGIHATGHKLAAGLFAVMLNLETERARGRAFNATTDAIMQYVYDTRALVGAGGVEACAGPPRLIRRTTAVFLGEERHESGCVTPLRLRVAKLLHQQIKLGIALRLFDEYVERKMLAFLSPNVVARNPFIRSLLDTRNRELAEAPAPPPPEQLRAFLPRTLDPDDFAALEGCLSLFERGLREPPPTAQKLGDLVRARRGALLLEHADPTLLGALALRAIEARRSWLRPLCQLEDQLREALGRAQPAPFRFSSLVLPLARCFPWFTAASAMQISLPCEPHPHVVLRDPTGHVEDLTLASRRDL